MPTNRPTVAMMGRDMGTTMLRKMRSSPAPSIWADSTTAEGMLPAK